jgi:translation elongation factor EF-G
VDSDEAPSRWPAGRAFRDGFVKAHPVLLEPLLDMDGRGAEPVHGRDHLRPDQPRGHITGMDSLGDMQLVKVRVPQREVLTYPTAAGLADARRGQLHERAPRLRGRAAQHPHEIQAGFKPKDDEE